MATLHKRKRIEPFINYFATQLSRLHVETKMNTEANTDLIADYAPDAVILATGANPIIPPLPGVEQGNVFTAIDILAGRVKAGQKVLVIGGGSIGCETAEFLVENGKEVTVAETLPELASDMGFRDRLRLLMRIHTLPINFITNARCNKILKDGVIVTTQDSQNQSIRADTVILAVGTKQNNTLYPLLKEKGIETHLIGDCCRIGKIAGAITDGLRLGCIL
jgi:pyruvate/2-oxoglutarate dehydrogenase complex dihydrolipoamide dehydrogenase (E3) component